MYLQCSTFKILHFSIPRLNSRRSLKLLCQPRLQTSFRSVCLTQFKRRYTNVNAGLKPGTSLRLASQCGLGIAFFFAVDNACAHVNCRSEHYSYFFAVFTSSGAQPPFICCLHKCNWFFGYLVEIVIFFSCNSVSLCRPRIGAGLLRALGIIITLGIIFITNLKLYLLICWCGYYFCDCDYFITISFLNYCY